VPQIRRTSRKGLTNVEPTPSIDTFDERRTRPEETL